MIVVYTLPICPNCDAFKSELDKRNIEYDTRDLEDDDVKMELLMNCVTLIDAPIIEINGIFYNKDDAMKELEIWSE